jgi:hypothetical protein
MFCRRTIFFVGKILTGTYVIPGWLQSGRMVGVCGMVSSLLALAPYLQKRP